MNPLEQEILKYEKKGFKKEQKKTLKYGSRIVLINKKGIFSTDEAVYIYYVDGDAADGSIRECFKDYEKFYAADEYDTKGLFLCSGNCDEKLFKDLRTAMFREIKIRNTIKLVSLGKSTEKVVEKEQPLREVVREKPDKDGERNAIEVGEIIARIKNFPIHKRPKNEKDLDSMLVSYLCAFYPNIETQISYQNSKIDAQLGNDVGIEFKYQPNIGELDRLYGQIEKYLKHFEKIVVVIGYERTRELTDSFEKRVKERGWLNNKVYIVSLR